jgi:hypothetical protein
MSASHATGSTWSWPKQEPTATLRNGSSSDSFAFEQEADLEREEEVKTEKQDDRENSQKQRYYAPRTCRICLEVVQPTYHPGSGGLTGLLNPSPSVEYISSDAESGRLIRPCKCKGSQRYVHEGCLQAWRHADPAYGRRNYWECPTCKFKYRLERMKWSKWISSTFTQLLLTGLILFVTIFVLGFIADPVINLYVDPLDTLTSLGSSGTKYEGTSSWTEHILKGLASLGLLGFFKAFVAMSPWQWWNTRSLGLFGGSGRGRGATGRDRLENINWTLVVIGVMTFLWVCITSSLHKDSFTDYCPGGLEGCPSMESQSSGKSR